MESNKFKINWKFQYPSTETLKRLFAAADEFQKLEPWKWMGDREVVAVYEFTTLTVGYCVVMGGDACYGLEVMLDNLGLLEYRRTIAGNYKSGSFDDFHAKDTMVLLLTDKDSLEKEDLALCKQTGTEYPAGSRAWPKFRRFEPGFFPWLLQEKAAVFMADCLEQVIEVAKRAQKNQDVLGIRDGKTFLARIRRPKQEKFVWEDEFVSPKPMERVIRIVPKVDLALLKKVFSAAKKKGMIWEADCFWGTVPVGKPGERLRYPYCYVISDKASFYVMHTNLSELNDHGANFLNEICEAVRKNGVFPETILIRHPHLTSVFAPLTAFGISTRVVDQLPCIEDVRKEMFNAFKFGGAMNPAQGTPAKQLKMTELIKTPFKKHSKQPVNGTVYQFKVTLDNLRSPIWRKFQVENDITLKRLAATILIVMGWTNSHLHQFYIGSKRYGLPQEDFAEYDDFENEGKFRLCDLSEKELSKFKFVYDFGDDWVHTVRLEKVLDRYKDVKYPVCIGGARKCPRENCGGPFEYDNFLSIISDPKDPEYPATICEVGEDFDPKVLDVDSVNLALKHVAQEEKSFDSFA